MKIFNTISSSSTAPSVSSTGSINSSSSKSLCSAFFFWITSGLFGSHHYYLRREKQAFLWFSSLGGLFIGWFYDLFRLSFYVDFSNKNPSTISHLKVDFHNNKEKPSWKFRHLIAMYFFAYYFGSIASTSFYPFIDDPQEPLPPISCSFRSFPIAFNQTEYSRYYYDSPTPPSIPDNAGFFYYFTSTCFARFTVYRLLSSILRGIGITFGGWLVLTATEYTKAPFRKVLWMTIVAQLIQTISNNYYHTYDIHSTDPPAVLSYNYDSSGWVVLFSVITLIRNRSWNLSSISPSSPPSSSSSSSSSPPRPCFRFLRFSLICLLFLCFVSIWLLNSWEIDGVQLKVALNNMRRSPEYTKVMNAFSEIWKEINAKGWKRIYDDLKDSFSKMDVGGTDHAIRILELDQYDPPKTIDTITLSDIKRARNKLALRYHPDKLGANIDEKTKEEAIKKFDEIQQACEVLEKAIRKKTNAGNNNNKDGDGETTKRTKTQHSTFSPSSSSSSSSSRTESKSNNHQQKKGGKR